MHQIFTGINRDVLKTFPDNSIDSLVTDPPYAYKFMGKKWDYELPSVEDWKEILRVLKPGAHALVACGTRTQHRMAVNLEDAGFEIRDVISWIYGSGFPKSMDISKAIDKSKGLERVKLETGNTIPDIRKGSYENSHGKARLAETVELPTSQEAQQWEGWGTALKPACEFWTLCRKPISENTIADNVMEWGVGGININDSRVPLNGEERPSGSAKRVFASNEYTEDKLYGDNTTTPLNGRFPANLIHDGSEEVIECFPDAKGQQGDLVNHTREIQSPNGIYGKQPPRYDALKRNETEASAARFFYAAKASKKEREAGLEAEGTERVNTHPTVKPISLMRYLCRLITPKGGIILDPYAGSGSTGCAAAVEGFNSILIEQDEQWKPKMEARIKYWENQEL
jgi:DNA modification methylase